MQSNSFKGATGNIQLIKLQDKQCFVQMYVQNYCRHDIQSD